MNQLGSRDDAEDAVQSTFLNAHRALQRGVTPEAELAWLFKIAHNVCLTRRRSTSRRGRVESAADLDAMQDYVPAPARESADELIRLTDALAHMPDNQRRAILLREWQGLSYREIADELKLSQSAVETLIFRARRSLAANLETAQESDAPLLKRVRQALDIGGVLAALKGIFSAGVAVKAAATAVAVTGAAVVATSPAEPAKRVPPAPVAPAAASTSARLVADVEQRASLRPARPLVVSRSEGAPRADVPVTRVTSRPTPSPTRTDTPAHAPQSAPPVVAAAVAEPAVAAVEATRDAEQPKKEHTPGPPPAAKSDDVPKHEPKAAHPLPKAEHPQPPVQQLAPAVQHGNAEQAKGPKNVEPGPPATVTQGPPAESPSDAEHPGNGSGNAGGSGNGRDK